MCIRDRGLSVKTRSAASNLVRKTYLLMSSTISIGEAVSYTHLRAHETVLDLVCRPPRFRRVRSSAASDVYKRQGAIGENQIGCIELSKKDVFVNEFDYFHRGGCLLYTSPSPRDRTRSRMPSSEI